MNEFLNNFGEYWSEAQFGSLSFWMAPVITMAVIWIMTIVGLKIFTRRKRLKTVFVVNRAWGVSSMIVAMMLIGIICYLWTENYFSQHPLELSFLMALVISMAIPLIGLLTLTDYYTAEGMKEITIQPKTPLQLESTISSLKKAYGKNKLSFLIPVAGFSMLLFALNRGNNNISIVFDNSESMQNNNAVGALSETFDNLDENNEIVLATLDGLQEEDGSDGKFSLDEIMAIQRSSQLKGGNVTSYNSTEEAINGLSRISGECIGSPICETIWKTYLFTREVKAGQDFENKLLVVITDGEDNLLGETLLSGSFLFDNDDFSSFFSPDRVFIIDYSGGQVNPLMQRFRNSGCDIYNVENNREDYINALDNALQKFMSNWNLVYWVIVIYVIFALISLIIQPKKIV
ncbi:MAG: hypothetical protein KFF73_12410 [Cyclobacteriaceae bacterium]|nr:hypothetical protein [Cyclobacteriaceae bacterium]